MDLETENRIAAILLKEAAELRREAQKEGALAYLREPTVRSRPNSRFLTATVRGVQQANRAVEVNEMWRLREKQLELDKKLRGTKSESNGGRGHKDIRESHTNTSRACNEVENNASASLSSKKRSVDHNPMEDEGLKDDEIDQFLQSRNKRGRGSVGSRMDETGPYLPLSPDSKNIFDSDHEMPNKARVVLGSKKPYSLKSSESSSDDDSRPHKNKKAKAGSSKRRHSRKHKSKDKSKDKSQRKRKDKKSKHHR